MANKNAETAVISKTIAMILIILSSTLYLPTIKIDTQITNNITTVHSPRKSTPKRFSKNPAVTNPTVPITKNMDATVSTKYNHNAGLPSFLYPSIILVQVELAYLELNSKKGYFNKIAKMTNPRSLNQNQPQLDLIQRKEEH